MNPDQIAGYIQVAMILSQLGVEVVGKMKALIVMFHPDHRLTDAQINAIERAGIADSERRLAEREAMGGAT